MKKLVLFLLVTQLMAFSDSHNVIKDVMLRELASQSELKITEIKNQSAKKLEELLSNSDHPELKELQELRKKYQDLVEARAQKRDLMLKDLNTKAQKVAALIKKYQDLEAKYERLKKDVDSSASSTQAYILEIEAGMEQATERLNEILSFFNKINSDAGVIASNLEAYLQAIESGTNPDAQDFKTIQKEIQSIVEEYERLASEEIADLDEKKAQYENWADDQNRYIENKSRDLQEDIDAFNRVGDQLEEDLEHIRDLEKRHQEAVNKANHYASFNVTEANFWVGVANDLAGEHETAVRHYNNLAAENQLTAADLNRRLSDFEKEQKRIEAEAKERASEYENSVKEFKAWAEERQKEVTKEVQELEAELKKLEEIISTNIEQQNSDLEALTKELKNNFSPDYAAFAKAFQDLGSKRKWSEVLELLKAIKNSGDYALLAESIVLVSQNTLGEAQIDAAITLHNDKVRTLTNLIAELNRIAEEHALNQAATKDISDKLNSYLSSSKKELEELAKEISKKEQELAEVTNTEAAKIVELYDAKARLIKTQSELIGYILLIKEAHLDAGKDAYTAAKDELESLAPGEKQEDTIDSIIATKPANQDTSEIQVSSYDSDKEITSSEVIEGDEKKALIAKWWQLMKEQGDSLSSEASELMTYLGRSEGSIWDFLYSLFVNGFFVESSIERVVFVDDAVGYRITVDGKIYWLTEAGELEVINNEAFALNYVFVTPEDTEVGKLLRSTHNKILEALSGNISDLTEDRLNAVIMAEALLRQIDQMEAASEEEKKSMIKTAEALASFGIGVTPILGDAQDLYEFVTGKDVFGNDIGTDGRIFAAAGIIVGNRVLWDKAAQSLGEGFSQLIRVLTGEEPKLLTAGKEVAKKAEDIAESAKEIGANTAEGVKEYAEVLGKYKIDPPNWPEGIGFNSDLKKHMSQLDGFTQKTGIKGAHNADAFQSAINAKGARIVNSVDHPTIPGVKNIDYEIPKLDKELNPIPGEYKGGFTKTIYDPSVIPDGEMLRLGQIASSDGYEAAVAAGKRIYPGKAGGLDFTIYLENGTITNVHPRFPQ